MPHVDGLSNSLSPQWGDVEEAGQDYRGRMNAVRSARRRGASIIQRPKRRGALVRTRSGHIRYSVSRRRRRRENAWADAMLSLRTFGWLSRRLGRLWIDEYAWRFRRRLGYSRR